MPQAVIAAGIAAGGGLLSSKLGKHSGGSGGDDGSKAALLGAGINAAGQLGGAYLASRGNDKASKLQAQLTREALQLERDRDAALAAQWNAREARLAPFRMAQESVLGSMFKNLPRAEAPAAMPPGWTPSMGVAIDQRPGASRTLGSFINKAPVPAQIYQPEELGSPTLGDWNTIRNWNRR